MIPKRIHYCWFGKNEKSKLALKCIASWKKFCPDYEIIEWNEDNFDIARAPLYVQQAYEHKKYAFVSDYVRLYALVTQGGIYMDIDVEVVRPLDEFLAEEAFSGFETDNGVVTGIMAGTPQIPLFQELLNAYEDRRFEKTDGNCDLTTNVEVITQVCVEKGMVLNGLKQTIEGYTVYPQEYFCPFNPNTGVLKKTKNTATIHWFDKSWLSRGERIRSTLTRPFHRVFGEDCFQWLNKKVK